MRANAFLLSLTLAACAHQEDAAKVTPPPAPPSAAATEVTDSATPMQDAATPPGVPTVAAAPTDTKAVAGGAEVTVGKPAPDFESHGQDGKPVHLAAYKGKYVVIYFYPKDETPGCTKEACSFRDAWTSLDKRGVVLIGVSADSDASHKAFTDHHKLPFTLVSDPNGEIAAKYGVPVLAGFIARQSFVVAPDGNVKKIYRKVDVAAHSAEITADVQ